MKILKRLCTVLVVFLLAMILLDGAVAGVVEETHLNESGFKTESVQVTLSLNDSFEITLPPAFNLDSQGQYLADYNLFNVNIHRLNASSVLYVNVSSVNSQPGEWFNMTNSSGTSKIPYVLGLTTSNSDHIDAGEENENYVFRSGGSIYDTNHDLNLDGDGKVSTFNGFIHIRTLQKESELSFTGQYSDTLTFEVHVVEHAAS